MDDHLTIAESSRAISAQAGCEVSPRILSDLFYRRILDVERCPICGDRRLIPRDYLPEILAVLRERGLIVSKERQR